jgi:hypothetical protein
MKQLMRKATWMMGLVSGIVWVLSWFALYLEIYRWRHVTPSLHLGGPSMPDTVIQASPGGFVLAVLRYSVLAPLLFVALLVWNGLWRPNADVPQRKAFGIRALVALPLIVSGLVVSVLGTINLLIHDPRGPIDFDLTMRHGNGGFIVNGMALAALGFALMRLSVERRNPS